MKMLLILFLANIGLTIYHLYRIWKTHKEIDELLKEQIAANLRQNIYGHK
jgi:hypothetical protein